MDKQAYQESFLHYLRYERGLSEHTQKNYARDINQLSDLTEKIEQQALAFDAIQPSHIRQSIASLYSQGLSAQSISRALSAWRTFFNWLCKFHQLKHNPTNGIKPPKRAKTLPKALTTDQAVSFVNIEGDDLLSVRDRAIFELFYSSGLRLSELVNITLEKLDLHAGELTVIGKGEKTRIVPMGQHAIKAILRWLDHRGSLKIAPQSQQHLFLSKQGTQLSARAVQSRMKVWAQRKGIDINLHPHLLRHSFASHVLQSSGDLRAVQEMLGHANISTTQVYTHLDFQHLAKTYDQAHPRAKKQTDSSK